MHKFITKNYKRIVTAMIALIVAFGGFIAVDQALRPAAAMTDGTKVKNPCVIVAGDTEVCLVKDKKTGNKVIEDVISNYTPENAQVASITINKKVGVSSKRLTREETDAIVLNEEEATEFILEANDTEKPMFTVMVAAEAGSIESLKAQTVIEDNDEEFEGNQTVVQEGVSGIQAVTDEITSVNGKILTSQQVGSVVLNDCVNKVVSMGTKERPHDTAFADYSGTVLASGNGSAVANFACKFVGNPYKWGGTSLTNGCDCSGFIYAVYRHFGVPCPRMGICDVGRGVCLAEARPGDVVYYPGHYAMYIGNGKIVHAYNSRVGIVISNVHAPGRILSIRRIVE